MLLHVVLLPISATLRRGFPTDVGFNRDAFAQQVDDFQNLMTFFSRPDVARILAELKRVPVEFLAERSNFSLPTWKDLPKHAPERCALVANGRSVLNSTAGGDVDAVDGTVLRLNNAVTRGFEAFVGKRTDALLVNDDVPCHWKHNRVQLPPQVKMVIMNDFGNNRSMCISYLRDYFPRVRVLALEFREMNRALQKLLDLVAEEGPLSLRRLGSTKASTSGLIGGLVLMNMCKEVLHYGFLESNDCTEHYFQRIRHRPCQKNGFHDMTREHVLWKVISRTEGVKFKGEGIVSGWPGLET